MGCNNSTEVQLPPGGDFDEKYESSSNSAGLGIKEGEELERMQAHNTKADTLSLEEVKKKALELFQRIDVDGSNALDKSEFVALASQHTSKNKKKQANIDRKADESATSLMKDCDTDNNGDVSPAEWQAMFVKSYNNDGAIVATDMIKWFTLLAEVLEKETKEKLLKEAAEAEK